MSDAAARASAAGDQPVPLTGPALFIGGVFLALANFMVVLDTTITNVSVPHIAGGLAVSPADGTWVITSYSVAEAITVPLTGWLAQRFGTVRVFCVAMALFAVCSALCGVASSLGMLVFFRVLQGLSGGPMIPLCQTLLRRIFPPKQVSTAMGLWAMTTIVAPIAGPILGGLLCDNVGWPSIFYINVPVALFVSFFAWRLLRSRETHTLRLKVDVVGMALLVVWVGSLQILLDKGQELDWFHSSTIWVLALIAAIGFTSFLIWELTQENPVVNLRIFRYRGFTVPALILAVTFGIYFASAVIQPLWLQTSMGYTATWAGFTLAFGGIMAVILSPVAARLTTKVDSRALVCFGILWLSAVTYARSQFTTDTDFGTIALVMFTQGFAMPFFFVPISGLTLTAVAPHETASAAGLSNFMRTTAAAFSASISVAYWDNAGTHARTEMAGRLNGAPDLIAQLTSQGMNAGQALGMINRSVEQQAVMLATDKVFQVSALMFVICALSVWLAPKPKRGGMAPGGGH
jgi:DHA2 family multidrug resistance protein